MGLLHTDSSYGPQVSFPSDPGDKSQRLKSQIDTLKKKETTLYQRIFGVSDYANFMKKLRELFNNKNDQNTFRFFSNENIRSYLYSKSDSGGDQVGIKFTITSDSIPLDNILNTLKKDVEMLSGKDGINLSITASGLDVKLGMDTKSVKEKINQYVGSNLKDGTGDLKTVFSLISGKDNRLLRKLMSTINSSDIKISNTTDTREEFFINTEVKDIFKYTAEDIKTALESKDPQLKEQMRQKLEDARSKIREFIWNSSNMSAASKEMQDAFKIVWDRNIGEKDLTNLAFFEKGGVLNSMIGAFGEFQSALLFEYANLKGAKDPNINAIISNTLKGEQLKVDVTIAQLGFQIKNYDPNRKNKYLETNIHPSKLYNYDLPNIGYDFLDFLANYFFNASYKENNEGEFENLENYLGKYFAELSNLAVSEQVDDVVSFYFISGNYLVPGSCILERLLANQLSTKKVKIDGPKPPYDDDFFEKFHEIRDRTRKEGLLSRYWVKRDGVWSATSYNENRWESLVSHEISIRGGFNYGKFTNTLAGFALF